MADRMHTITPEKPLLALLVAYGLIFFCAGAESWAWQSNVSGTAVGGQFNATAVDAAGNVVAAGVTNNTDTGNDFTVVKFDGATGAELWRQVISGGSGTGLVSDVANAVAIDGAGNVVAAGVIWHTSPTSRAKWSDMLVVKLEKTSGAELWRQVITGSFNDQDPLEVEDVANAVAIDGVGNVVVGGRINYTSAVLKLDGVSGAELWRQFIDGSAGGRTNVNAVAVDGAGNVVAAGSTFNTGTGRDFTVVKFDGASGTELWRQAINGVAQTNGSEVANAVVVDGAGHVVAAGAIGTSTGIGTHPAWVVMKFDGASGAILWRQATGDVDDSNTAQAVGVDGAGNVVATGFVHAGGLRLFKVIKYDGASGAVRWNQPVVGTATPNGEGRAVAADGAGNVVTAGYTHNTSPSDFTVVKLDGTSGAELWHKIINGTANTYSLVYAVAIDGAGNAIAAGAVNNTATVVKLRGTDGSDFAPSTGTLIEETAANVQYAGCSWYSTSHSMLSGGSAWLAMETGAQVRATFTGTGLRWIGYRDPWAGKANVYLDGTYHSTVDTYASTSMAQAEVLRISDLPAGDHWLIIEPTGTHHEQSNGSWVWLDAVDVENADGSVSRVENTAAAVQDLNCPWYTTTHSSLSGGSARAAMVAGAQAIFSFSGTGVSWVTYRNEWTGKARVFLDGVLQGEVDTYATPAQAQAVMSTINGLASGAHVLIIEATGEQNPASSGTWVWVDAFQVQP